MSPVTADKGGIKFVLKAFRCKYPLLTVIFMTGTFFFLLMNTSKNNSFIEYQLPDASNNKPIHHHTTFPEQKHTEAKGCSIPKMEALSSIVQKFVYYPKDLKNCQDSDQKLIVTNKLQIWINKTNVQNYIQEPENMTCCYYGFRRPEFIQSINSHSNDHRVTYDNCTRFTDSIKVRDEFVKVACFVDSKKIYEQYFLFAPKKKLSSIAAKSKNVPEFNVIILGIDAVSRLNFFRTMPKTVELLLSKGAVDMTSYNKVGDNTFPNLVPMLLGFRANELKGVCLPHARDSTFDNCPFVWEWYKEAGYYTALGEDSSFLGTFNYLRNGFLNNPTDYYIHPFIHEAEKKVGTPKKQNTKLCMHDTPFYKVLLDYVEDITTTLEKSKLFGFFWEITMSHDYLNYPMLMDDDYVNLFNKLEDRKYLNNSVIIVVSDHGIRWGGIRQTKQGRLEERLPFLFMLTPPSFRTKYSQAFENLKLNSQRLTTPFDVHATLTDLIDPKSRINNTSIFARSKSQFSNNRSISLFLPIPQNRTCKAADIDDHWCTCLKYISLPTTNAMALEAAASLLSILNEYLKDLSQCAQLTHITVKEANLMESGTIEKNEVGWEELILITTTTPGNAIFEATMRKDKLGWSLSGTISRLNLYGNQSHCVDDSKLKLYCYCI